jgi:Family of unknown function (DUF6159)
MSPDQPGRRRASHFDGQIPGHGPVSAAGFIEFFREHRNCRYNNLSGRTDSPATFIFVTDQVFARFTPRQRSDTMFERLATGWSLAKQSLRVLRLDKELLIFPLLSGTACILVLATFAIPLYATGAMDSLADENPGTATKILAGVTAFLYYFINYFIIIFFNSALVACAIIRLKGGNPVVSDGIGAAMARLPQIAGWALVAATVGLILKAIESRSERVGQIVSSLLGMAWTIVTFFVIPVLVVEKKGPVEAVKRSTAIMKQTWGESLAANFGVGLITFLAMLVGFALIVPGSMLLQSSGWLGGILIAAGILWILTVSLIASALNSIVVAALYIYAAEGKAPEHFDGDMIHTAFVHK